MAFLTPNATGEAAVLSSFVRNQFAQVRSSVFGLSDEQLRDRSTVSDFTLAGLLEHVGSVATTWVQGIESVGSAEPGAHTERVAESVQGRTGEQLLADFDRRVGRLSATLDRIEAGDISLDGLVPVPPAPWFPKDLTHWQVRWVLAHVATETARHAGHADIIRESIDGKGSYELNALVDGNDWS